VITIFTGLVTVVRLPEEALMVYVPTASNFAVVNVATPLTVVAVPVKLPG
jgi:hypothetical protein